MQPNAPIEIGEENLDGHSVADRIGRNAAQIGNQACALFELDQYDDGGFFARRERRMTGNYVAVDDAAPAGALEVELE